MRDTFPQPEHQSKRVKVLFLCEAVTLAHVARPASLAAALDTSRYEIHFAHCPRYRPVLGEVPGTEHLLDSIAPEQFAEALAEGRPLYDLATLEAYVEQELSLLCDVQPDVVVTDFRITAAVSAELAGIPSISVSNACWSPYVQQHYVVPDLPLVRTLGVVFGQLLFSIGRPVAFALHARPMAQLRRRRGLAAIGLNLNRVYTHADYTLYADVPDLYSLRGLPTNHRVIGPVPWSPDDEIPAWWEEVVVDKPTVYLTPGSSGRADLLPAMVDALAQKDFNVLVATVGKAIPKHDNVFSAAFLPGEKAASRADIVVCNGGSPTTHQALACGKPVLGVPTNLDQFLNMQTLVDAGVGISLRADQFDSVRFADAVDQLLTIDAYTGSARRMSQRIEQHPGTASFKQFMDDSDTPWWRARNSLMEV